MIWKGPHKDGITQSLLGQFLSCRERFKLRVIDGLEPDEQLNVKLEYGNMFHLCEETHLAGGEWKPVLFHYVDSLALKYPLQSAEIDKWYNVCLVQYPIYLDHYKDYVSDYEPLLQEYSFSTKYRISGTRVVTLRGKFDAVNITKDGEVWLQENKTKTEIDETSLLRQLPFDMQTCFYLIALRQMFVLVDPETVQGVDYNVIRRPLSGGKGTIVQHKPSKSNPAGETSEEYYGRLRGIIQSEPESYFWRRKVRFTLQDLIRFEETFLIPVLNQLYDWWEYQKKGLKKYKHTHFRMPYGVYLPLMDGRNTYLDNYLDTGDTTGLKSITNLFPEL